MFVILGVALALLLLLAGAIYLWAKWRNKRRRHVSGGERVYRGSTLAGSEEAEDDSADEADSPANRRRYKYRVRRRTHRSRNPTLSETGGLPPAKSREPSQPC